MVIEQQQGISRRRFLAGMATGVTAIVTGIPNLKAYADTNEPLHLVAAPAQAPLLAPDYDKTLVWAYDGTVPGSLIRVRRGDEVYIRLRNNLPEPTTVHWHGVRLENAMDGVAGLTQQPVLPGEVFDYRFIVPDAGTYWYHPHYRSWEQLARGLYGLLIVDELDPPEVNREVVLIFDDWRVGNDGQIDEDSFDSMMDRSHAGRLGNVLTVNGESQPNITVRSGEMIRLRLLNAANARVMSLHLVGLNSTLVALDGQPTEPREILEDRVTLAPGQRADVIVYMEGEPGSTSEVRLSLRDHEVVAANFFYTDEPSLQSGRKSTVAKIGDNALPTPDLTSPEHIVIHMEGGAMGQMRSANYKGRVLDIRELVQRGMVWALNGTVGRPDNALFQVPVGRTVVVELRNENRWPHAMHFHGHHVLPIKINDQTYGYKEWRDTVLLQGGDTLTVAFVADNPGRWMIHCHMLEHQAAGMVTWFQVGA